MQENTYSLLREFVRCVVGLTITKCETSYFFLMHLVVPLPPAIL
jgi:hypothetical protein